MSVPWFKIRHLEEEAGLVTLSANFALYGDLVRRARTIRKRIHQWIGIPTCIGIGPTKTLAKLANAIAKNKPGSNPAHHAQICHLGAYTHEELQAMLQATEVGDVWGVGREIGSQLREHGIHTALDQQRLAW